MHVILNIRITLVIGKLRQTYAEKKNLEVTETRLQPGLKFKILPLMR